MDGLGAVLERTHARDAFVLRVAVTAPWCVRIQDEAPLAVCAVHGGTCRLALDEGPSVDLDAGDVVLLRGPGHYVLSDADGTEPQAIIHPDQSCTAPDGSSVAPLRTLGVRTWGNDPDGSTQLLVGVYTHASEVGHGFLRSLPIPVVVRRDDFDPALLALFASELARARSGQEAVLDRIVDLLLAATVRAWYQHAGRQTPGWHIAYADPVVADAVAMMMDDPGARWTVATLATATSVSRATFARRFTALVGQAPMAFLAELRLRIAADRLRDPGATLAAVAREVGYGSAFALSAAFKRVRGMSPTSFRRMNAQR